MFKPLYRVSSVRAACIDVVLEIKRRRRKIHKSIIKRIIRLIGKHKLWCFKWRTPFKWYRAASSKEALKMAIDATRLGGLPVYITKRFDSFRCYELMCETWPRYDHHDYRQADLNILNTLIDKIDKADIPGEFIELTDQQFNIIKHKL